MKTPIPIQHITLHTNPDLDAIAATWSVIKRGEPQFPGVSQSIVRYTAGMEAHDDTWFDRSKMLPLDCIPGTRFCDKDKDGKRIPNVCTTTMVHEYLEVDEPVLEKIAREVLRCDTEGGVRTTELAELIKLGHARVADNETVRKWATTILDALESQLTYNFARLATHKTLADVFQTLCEKDSETEEPSFPDERARTRVKQCVEESMARKGESITELSFVTEALYCIGHPDAFDLVTFALRNIYDEAVGFREDIKVCNVSLDQHTVGFFHEGRVSGLRVLLVKSDSQRIVRASRHQKAGAVGITIVRNSKGNVSILADRKRRGLLLDDYTAMVRWLEWPKDKDGKPLPRKDEQGNTVPDLTWEELQVAGTLPEVPNWFYARNAGHLLNGGLTHPGVPNTEMSSQMFVDLSYCAFDPRELREWKRRRGISCDGKRTQSQSRPEGKYKNGDEFKNTPHVEHQVKLNGTNTDSPTGAGSVDEVEQMVNRTLAGGGRAGTTTLPPAVAKAAVAVGEAEDEPEGR